MRCFRVTRAAAILMLPLLVGCDPVFKTTAQGLLRVSGVNQPDLQVQAIDPRAGYLHLTGSADALMVLAFREHGREIWYGAGGVTFTLEQGVVLRGTGLPDGDYLTRWSDDAERLLQAGLQTLPVGQSVPLTKTRTVTRDGRVQLRQHRYHLHADGLVPVTLWGQQQRQLLQLREAPDAGVDWPGNRYWVDPDTGAVMASEQWFSPSWRVFLTPREAFAQQPVVRERMTSSPEQTMVWRQVVAQRQRLSTLLRPQVAAQLQPAHQLVWLAAERFPEASREARDLTYRVRDLRVSLPPESSAVMARLQQRLQALTPVPRQPVAISDAFALLARPDSDPWLAPGDVISQMTSTPPVQVVAADGFRCTHPWQPALAVRDYLAACASRSAASTTAPDAVVLVQGHGQPLRVNLASWMPRLGADVTPGSVLQLPVPGWPVASADAVRAQRDPLTRLALFWWQQAALPVDAPELVTERSSENATNNAIEVTP